MTLQERTLVVADFGEGIKPVVHDPADRQPGELFGGDVGQRGEGAFENQAAGAVASRQIDHHAAAEGAAEQLDH